LPYSITDGDADGQRLSIAVKREPSGGGGSVAVRDLPLGSVIGIAPPRNNFALRTEQAPIVIVGGGIGITPLYAMARVLQAAGRSSTCTTWCGPGCWPLSTPH
jgi:ferredoxin-NADP reductase